MMRIAVLTALLALGLISPVTAAERGAAGLSRVYRAVVQPHWLEGGSRFWYRVQTGREEWEYIMVDAEKGTRSPAFDHARLAEALLRAGCTNVTAQRLSLDRLELDLKANRLSFRCGGKGWLCDLAGYTLENRESRNTTASGQLSSGRELRASRRTGEESTITFINQSGEEVTLFWLDTEGQRKSYGKLAPGETREQHTFAGHVWLVLGKEGQTRGVFEAEETSADAVISEKAPEIRASPRRRTRGIERGKSPDGRWRAVFQNHNVLLKDESNGTEKELTRDGTAEDGYSEPAYWSPDSQRVVVLRKQQGDTRKVYLIESSPSDQLQPKLHSYDYLKPGDRIEIDRPHLFDVSAGCEILIEQSSFPNPWSVSELRWAPDSSRFTFLYNQRGHQVLRVVAVDAKSGRAQALVDEQSATFIDYSGKHWDEYLDDTGELLWMSERDGWNHLYLFDTAAGRLKNQVTRGTWVVRGVERVDREKRQVWFRAGGVRPGQDPYFVHYCRVNFDGSGLVVLTEGDGTHTVEFSPDRRWFIDKWSRVDQPPVHEMRRSDDGRLVCRLEAADVGELYSNGRRPPERFVAKGRDGETDIYGLIHWPKHLNAGAKCAVIESIYAGPQDAFVPKSFHSSYSQERLTERGFIVVQIDGMGTSQRSKKFHDVCWKNLGDSGFPDRVAWLKAAAQAHREMDLTRVGIYGTSAGGQSALRALLGWGDFYKAAVADCGCHDNRMDKIWWNEQWMGWPVGPHYEEQSNVTQAGRLKGKLLLMVGELDRNVDPASTMQVVNALIKADKDFELLVMPGAGHGVLGSPYAQRRLQDFFQRTLGQ